MLDLGFDGMAIDHRAGLTLACLLIWPEVGPFVGYDHQRYLSRSSLLSLVVGFKPSPRPKSLCLDCVIVFDDYFDL